MGWGRCKTGAVLLHWMSQPESCTLWTKGRVSAPELCGEGCSLAPDESPFLQSAGAPVPVLYKHYSELSSPLGIESL